MNLAKFIDHTLLKPDATRSDIETLCQDARTHGFFSVCVNGSWVSTAVELLHGSGVAVAAVTGFPLGAMNTKAKAYETEQAIADGATEIDTVINIGRLKDKDDAYVLADLKAVVVAAKGHKVKVIFETCLLNDEEKERASNLSVEAGAAFVKTSTGFSTGGATLEDVKLMSRTVDGKAEVKASGGIRDLAAAQAMVDAGATRLGTSSGIAILAGKTVTSGY
ncbi:deoxyribose-phosphate aldolase [soil metagenome]